MAAKKNDNAASTTTPTAPLPGEPEVEYLDAPTGEEWDGSPIPFVPVTAVATSLPDVAAEPAPPLASLNLVETVAPPPVEGLTEEELAVRAPEPVPVPAVPQSIVDLFAAAAALADTDTPSIDPDAADVAVAALLGDDPAISPSALYADAPSHVLTVAEMPTFDHALAAATEDPDVAPELHEQLVAVTASDNAPEAAAIVLGLTEAAVTAASATPCPATFTAEDGLPWRCALMASHESLAGEEPELTGDDVADAESRQLWFHGSHTWTPDR